MPSSSAAAAAAFSSFVLAVKTVVDLERREKEGRWST